MYRVELYAAVRRSVYVEGLSGHCQVESASGTVDG